MAGTPSRRSRSAGVAAAVPPHPTSVTVFGAALFALLPLSTDIYLPAMIDLARDMNASFAGAQRTMLAFTVGFALSHFLIGGLADRIGRRPVALGGVLLFILASLLGAVAPTLDLLLAARLAQGAAAAVGPILARTLIRDVIPGQAGRALSLMGALVGLAPITAPLLGAWAVETGGWRAPLWLLAGYAGLLGVVVAFRLPETLPRTLAKTLDARRPRSPLSPWPSLPALVRNPAFRRGTLAIACGYGAVFTWLSTSPFLLMGELGMTRLQMSLVYALGSVGFLGGGLLSARLALRAAPQRILLWGALLALGGTVACLAVVTAGGAGWFTVFGTMLPFYVGWGFCQPQATAIAMQPFPAMAGHASAWLGIIQQAGAVLLSSLAVACGGGTASLAVMTLGAAALAAIALRGDSP